MEHKTRWEAISKDGKVLKQFEENGIEHKFSDIDQDNLFEFRLIYENRLIISLFLEKGIFGFNGFLYSTPVSNRDLNYKLIYYKKHYQNIGESGTSSTVYYRVGYEVKTKAGRTKKYIVSLHNNFLSFIEPM